MQITLDQLRALDALDRCGTVIAAGKSLHKAHSAVLYALAQLEAQTDLVLLDRSGYRTRLTAAGRRVLEEARRVLEAERALGAVVRELRTGWEPTVRVVFDGILPAEPLLRVIGALRAEDAPTRVVVSAAFLGGVEEAFERDAADVMLAVLPPLRTDVVGHRLPPLRASLVAHRDHPLARARETLDDARLEAHVLLTVRGGDPRLALSTRHLQPRSTVVLDDFHAKRAAIREGLGYGWLPSHLCAEDLRRGRFRLLRYARGAEHLLAPRVYVRRGARLGPAAQRFLHALRAR
jgi:DNA-binding transcriptional LysR family regulator